MKNNHLLFVSVGLSALVLSGEGQSNTDKHLEMFLTAVGLIGYVSTTIGTVLVSLGLGLQLGNIQAEAKTRNRRSWQPIFYDDSNGASVFNGHQRTTRRRRWKRRTTVNDTTLKFIANEKILLENYVDDMYRMDKSQCIEKMICNVAAKNAGNNQKSTADQKEILKLLDFDLSHGLTYKRMVIGSAVGAEGGDCDFLFDSCPLEGTQMVDRVLRIANRI